jgi:hypothetical protein
MSTESERVVGTIGPEVTLTEEVPMVRQERWEELRRPVGQSASIGSLSGIGRIWSTCSESTSATTNNQRPHRGLGLFTPQGRRQSEPIACAGIGDVSRRDLLGGLLHENYQAAA